MGRRTDAQVADAFPIAAVVARLEAGAGEARYFVVPVSCAGQHGVQQRVVRFAQALAGRVERAALEAFPECRAGLDGEVVGRQVRHVKRQKVVQRPPPLLDGQLRQTVDQVERQIGETGRLRVAHRSERLPRVVPAVHPSQVAIHSDCTPMLSGWSGSAQRFQITGGQVVRIRFDGDLFDLRVERVADRAYQPLQFAGRADRRCPSSDVERSYRLPLQLVRRETSSCDTAASTASFLASVVQL